MAAWNNNEQGKVILTHYTWNEHKTHFKNSFMKEQGSYLVSLEASQKYSDFSSPNSMLADSDTFPIVLQYFNLILFPPSNYLYLVGKAAYLGLFK